MVAKETFDRMTNTEGSWTVESYFSAYEQLSADEVREIWLAEGEARR